MALVRLWRRTQPEAEKIEFCMKKYFYAFLAGVLMLPAMTYAETDFFTIIDKLQSILNRIVPFLIAVMVVLFVWGVVQYSTAADEEKQEKARKFIISSLIGLFIVVSFWGLIKLLDKTLGLDANDTTELVFPCVEAGTVICP